MNNWYRKAQSDAPKRTKFTNQYTCGGCAEFAVALHKMFGWPLGAFYEITPGPDFEKDPSDYDRGLIHAFAYHPSGMIADVRGLRSREAVKPNLVVMNDQSHVSEEKVTPDDLDFESSEGLDADLVNRAINWIRRNQRFYK